MKLPISEPLRAEVPLPIEVRILFPTPAAEPRVNCFDGTAKTKGFLQRLWASSFRKKASDGNVAIASRSLERNTSISRVA